MAEAIGAAATLISIVGFSAQVFDGCVKGFVLLSSAQNLGQDADMLISMLEWEQFRLEQWAEKAGLHDPAKADILLDWKLITTTLQHVRDMTNDTEVLKEKYKLVLVDGGSVSDEKVLMNSTKGEEKKGAASPFKRLFGQSARNSSTAAAKVIQSKNTATKKLWWAAVDKQNFQQLVSDISHFVQRLHDLLDFSLQTQMQKQIEGLLENAAKGYITDIPDLEVLRGLAYYARNEPPGYEDSHAEEIAAEIEKRFRNELFHAIRQGNSTEVEDLLNKGVDVQANDHVGWPPLLKAAEYGKLDIVELLLKRGADPRVGTIGNRLPLHFAAENGHLEIVKTLLQQAMTDINQVDYCGQTALFKSAENSRNEIVEFLLQREEIKPDIGTEDDRTALLAAYFHENKALIERLLDRTDVNPNQQDKFGQTPLWSAASCGDEILAITLARRDIDINFRAKNKETALYRAAHWGGPNSLQMLLDAGADPNIGDRNDQTPLGWAAENGKEEAIEILLKHSKTDISQPDKSRRSPLSQASAEGHVKCVKLLLAKGADVESTDKEGRTALSIAAAKGYKVVVRFLLKNKANINTQDHKGNTPLALAAVKNHDAVVRFLLENGADAKIADEDEETPFEKARDKHMDQIVGVFKEVLKI